MTTEQVNSTAEQLEKCNIDEKSDDRQMMIDISRFIDEKLCAALRQDGNALITGSLILYALLYKQGRDPGFYYNDVDIFLFKNSTKTIEWVKANCHAFDETHWSNCVYKLAGDSSKHIESISTTVHSESGMRFQLIYCTSPKKGQTQLQWLNEIIKCFDFSVCVNSFDGLTLHCGFPRDINDRYACINAEKLSEALKPQVFPDDQPWFYLATRVDKYHRRGFYFQEAQIKQILDVMPEGNWNKHRKDAMKEILGNSIAKNVAKSVPLLCTRDHMKCFIQDEFFGMTEEQAMNHPACPAVCKEMLMKVPSTLTLSGELQFHILNPAKTRPDCACGPDWLLHVCERHGGPPFLVIKMTKAGTLCMLVGKKPMAAASV